MPYDPALVQPMREELTRCGVEELTSADQVSTALDSASGTQLLVINSVCGCAAGGARPGVQLALQHATRPDKAYTVFAGQDLEATEAARGKMSDFPPSSPCLALFKDGEVVHFVPRHMIEGRDAQSIAFDLVEAFEKHCG
ncbi:MAG: BrxA/BrxB family bacilliredoxin [Planctomycetota bacterium]